MEGSIVTRVWILTALSLCLGCGRAGLTVARGDRDARGELTPTVDASAEAGLECASPDGPMVEMPPADSQATSRPDAGIPDGPGDNPDLPPLEVDAQPIPCQMDDDCEPGLYCDYSDRQLVSCPGRVGDFALAPPGSCRPVPCGDAGCPAMPCTTYRDCTKDGRDNGLDCYRPRLGCLPEPRCLTAPLDCTAGCVRTVGKRGFCWECLCPHC